MELSPSESIVDRLFGSSEAGDDGFARPTSLENDTGGTNKLAGVAEPASTLDDVLVPSELDVSALAGGSLGVALGLRLTASLHLGGGASPGVVPSGTGTPNLSRLCVELTKATCSGVGPAAG